MNATGLPIAPATNVAPTPAGEAPTATSAHAPADFVLALAQMLGSSVPTSAATTELTNAEASTDEALPTDANAAALGLIQLPIVQMQLPPQPDAGTEVDLIESLGLSPRAEGPSARDVAMLQALTERLAGVEEIPSEPQVHSTATSSIEAASPKSIAEAPHTRPLHQPVGTRAWVDELGSRLTMMTDKGQHTASIRLSPEHLGPLEIRIAMRDDQASVWFGAAHADTRAAIEHALPRLRELFASEGMSLADAGVYREPPQQQPVERTQFASGSNEATVDVASTPARVQVGLLDAYA